MALRPGEAISSDDNTLDALLCGLIPFLESVTTLVEHGLEAHSNVFLHRVIYIRSSAGSAKYGS